jgi:hypothetical protein
MSWRVGPDLLALLLLLPNDLLRVLIGCAAGGVVAMSRNPPEASPGLAPVRDVVDERLRRRIGLEDAAR